MIFCVIAVTLVESKTLEHVTWPLSHLYHDWSMRCFCPTKRRFWWPEKTY